MSDSQPKLRSAREATIDALCQRFAADELSMGELDRRLATARAATTHEELRSLLSDLAVPAVPPPTLRRGRSVTAAADATRVGAPRPRDPAGARRGSHLAIAVMGGTRRAGKWEPPGSMLAIALMGGVELDFREAVLGPGVTEIKVFAFWGGVEITVPPNVHVDTHGMAIMAGFDQGADQESRAPVGAPTIRINGLAIMAGVDVNVRSPGETEKKRTERSARREERGRNGER